MGVGGGGYLIYCIPNTHNGCLWCGGGGVEKEGEVGLGRGEREEKETRRGEEVGQPHRRGGATADREGG